MSERSAELESNPAIPGLDEEQRRKFEEDKARKRKDACSPWPAEAWQAAWAASRAGVIWEPRFPTIITDFMTPQRVQELAGLPSLPETTWTITTGFASEELDNPEALQYCVVDVWAQLKRVDNGSTGEEVRIWFEGKKRIAWSGHAEAQKSDDTNRTHD
ncbi:hypothetical protein BDV34DRAFT_59963 [Aspergillus parasiticus]|uniref:Uncharacterized protein n=1 Tax=Aspergillus parasiticus TaxID=5067 RepID=A0A5N6DRS5_ASPPA|nr:hypothetical protein BDV34DRAFT_59963 [Aspergillus parasiticus]